MTIEKEQLDKLNNNFEPEALKELKIHQEAVKDSSLLAQIREKEIEIKRKVIETQIEADKIVQKAREKAEALRPKVEAQAAESAKKYYEEQLTKIDQEAKRIEEKSAQKIKDVERISAQNYDEALSKLAKLLIPE